MWVEVVADVEDLKMKLRRCVQGCARDKLLTASAASAVYQSRICSGHHVTKITAPTPGASGVLLSKKSSQHIP